MSATGQVTYQTTYQDWLAQMAADLLCAMACERVSIAIGDLVSAAHYADETERLAATAWRGIALDRAIRACAYPGEWRRITAAQHTGTAA